MDSAQMFVFDLGWLFFAAWGTILVALGVLAFGRDLLLPFEAPCTPKAERPRLSRQTSALDQ